MSIPAGLTPVSISCGSNHTIVLMSNGTIYGCGSNTSGQLGNGTNSDSNTLVSMSKPAGLTPVSVSCGEAHTIVLMSNGTIYGCGWNGYGQLGNGTIRYNATTTLVSMSNTTGKIPVAVACGYNYSIVLMADGTVWGCGDNYYGPLGDNSSSTRSTLVQMKGLNGTGFINNIANISNVANYLTISSPSESVIVNNSIIGYALLTNITTPTPTYTISPSVAGTGLTFNTTSGLLTGIPTNISTTSYTITNTNATPNKSVTYTLTVNQPPPPYLTISSSSESVQFYSPITGYTLSTNVANPTYSISPSVVGTGLTFNTTTGLLSGSFTNNTNVINTAVIYTITNTNATPNKSVTYTINVTRPDKPVLCIQFV